MFKQLKVLIFDRLFKGPCTGYVPVIVNKLCNHAVIPRHLLNYAGCILNFAYNFSEMFSWREHVTMVVTSWLTCWDGE